MGLVRTGYFGQASGLTQEKNVEKVRQYGRGLVKEYVRAGRARWFCLDENCKNSSVLG
jgi:hypothetical protein